MTNRRRPNPVTAETVFRTYQLDDELRQALKSRRQALGLTVRAFVAQAIEEELDALVEAVKRELPMADKKGRPARLPLTEGLLGRLQEAGTATSLPASRLLVACLARAASRKRRRISPGKKAEQ
ncbi:MAG: hypothetical protein K2R98_26520 [Gemmataceae bacterium]|nr:hypothetical protein [Gemmataceae bacterium]